MAFRKKIDSPDDYTEEELKRFFNNMKLTTAKIVLDDPYDEMDEPDPKPVMEKLSQETELNTLAMHLISHLSQHMNVKESDIDGMQLMFAALLAAKYMIMYSNEVLAAKGVEA